MGSEDAYQGLTIQGLNAEESFEPYYYNWQWYYSVDITMDGNRTIEFIAGANQWIATASNRGDSFLVIEEAPATVTDEAGVGEGVAYGEPVTVSRENGWSYIWTELPARTESGDPYVYTVSEISVNGVAVDQAPCLVEIVDEGNNVFTIKNTTTETMGYELPETGSTGHYPIYMAGALLVLSAGLMYMKRRQRKEGNG
jgi:LPXTG-motif cell wall-anchored protein